jgi:hypothetical protein
LTKKQRRDLVRRETGDLIEGLVGAVSSGNILSNLKQVNKIFPLSDTVIWSKIDIPTRRSNCCPRNILKSDER